MGIEHRCLLRYRIETQNTKVNLVELDDVLEEYKHKHIAEIQNLNIDKLLKFQFLDLILHCSIWLEVDMTLISEQFKQKLFESPSSFFGILEKFIYKHISMPRPEYPYSIQKSALKVLVEIEDVQEYIDKLNLTILSSDEKELLNYWSNDRDY